MKCQSCSENIPPKFAHAIKSNSCPYCGQEIMEAALQLILSDLQSIMKDGESYMEQIEEWLHSNYGLHKGGKVVDSGNIEDGSEEDIIRRQTEAAKSSLPSSSFQKRAGIKQQDMKTLVEKIQDGRGAADPSEFVGEDPDYGHIDMGKEESSGPITERDAIQMMASMSGNTGPKNDSENIVEQYYEIQKLKKLQSQMPSGLGRFSRGG